MEAAVPGNREPGAFHDFDSNTKADSRYYIKVAALNCNWLTKQEIMAGSKLELVTSDVPEKSWGLENRRVSILEMQL